MATERNWYEVLRVHPQAPPELIKKSFQVLAQTWHPDKGGDGTVDMQDLTMARDILLDPDRRKAFDAHLAAKADAERRQHETTEPHVEEIVEQEVVDDWGQEEAWVPHTNTTAAPPSEPHYPPTWHPTDPDQHGYNPNISEQTGQQGYVSPYQQQFTYVSTPRSQGATREDLFGRSTRARISGVVLLIVSALPIVLGLLSGSGISSAMFLLTLLGVSVWIGRSYVEGRKTWPFMLWVALSVIFTLGTANTSTWAGLFFGVWTVAYLVSVLSRRADFRG